MSAIVGETLVFGQRMGGDIRLVTFGDEFYARYETPEGYTVVYDVDLGCYCYVALDGSGRFVSTGTPVLKPAPAGVKKHLKETGSVRNEKFTARYTTLRPPEPLGESSVLRTLGANDGLLEGRQVGIGTVKGLTILVEFDDVQTDVDSDDVFPMLNDPNYTANGNFCSVHEYYRLMSGGTLHYTNDVVGPVHLSRRLSYYINHPLMSEALDLAIAQFNLDLTEYDSLDEGVVDALSFLYAGRTMYKNWLWPHNSVMDYSQGGVRTHYYTIQSLGRRAIDLSIGTFTHESGHMLCRFPDLYDYGERDGDFEKSEGLGYYCLMSSGNHLNYGKTPAPVCVYLRDLAGWCSTEVRLDQPGTHAVAHGAYTTVTKFPTGKPNEYFLVENRSRMGLDSHLPDAGLAVFHCDTRGSNELQDGTPDKHYQCALLQADGRRDLENGANSGDTEDLFDGVPGVALSDTTNPSSREWSGADSGLVIRDVGAAGATIEVVTGDSVGNTVTVSDKADQIIPDDDPNGITRTIAIDPTGTLKDIRVTVDIVHSFRGDLTVELESPTGTKAVLHQVHYDSMDNLHLALDSSADAVLQPFRDEAVHGDWKLHVKDTWKSDSGRLDTWTLSIDFESKAEEVVRVRNPNKAIPDNVSTGVEDKTQVSKTGTLTDIEVEVGITHTYRGDLQVELTSPSGQIALLRPADAVPGTNLNESWTARSLPALSAMLGKLTSGQWKLRVRDLAPYDSGTLDTWTLKLYVT